ncbi:hypothetical protein DFP72DRAFT_570861 [Ephemerocybe angulata]|uniref:Uncharacterized protein n=1 Tax=Ephemerocybe angulata TaxID=980116 RepID=A0A8H6IES6_9AGAR|nr:hypothetical protein DFP72DRAFT_570861 [Tulosesus angulatus]
MSSSASSRVQRQKDLDTAFQVQAEAGVYAALRATGIGIGLAVIAHHTWPAFRRQTIPFKAFLISGFTCAGLVFGAETALLEHETARRVEENAIRRAARIDLARQGLIGTESEIAKWRTEHGQ